MIPVCYKGLYECEIANSERSGKIPIVYLSAQTNAHLSRSTTPYSYAVWCKYVSGYEPGPAPIPPTGCYDLSDSNTTCEGYGNQNGIAQYDPGCHADPKSLCSCVWNATTTPKCTVKWGLPPIPSPNINPITNQPYLCNYYCTDAGTDATECSGGSKILRTSATITSSDPTNCLAVNAPAELNCQSGSATISCGTLEEASLPFFGAWQFIISLVSIALVYALVGRKSLI
jgi:hypothetical protein